MMKRSKAQELFDAWSAFNTLEDELYDIVTDDLGIKGSFNNWTFDWYDESIEFKKAANDLRLSAAQQEGLWNLGFTRTWLCHLDGWETYYYKDGDPEGYRQDKNEVSI